MEELTFEPSERVKEVIRKNKEKIAIKILLSIFAPILITYLFLQHLIYARLIAYIIIPLSLAIILIDYNQPKEEKTNPKKELKRGLIIITIGIIIICIILFAENLLIIPTQISSFYLIQRLLWSEINEEIKKAKESDKQEKNPA